MSRVNAASLLRSLLTFPICRSKKAVTCSSSDWKHYAQNTETRSGMHHTAVRAYVAPIDTVEKTVSWQSASHIDPQRIDMRAVPDPERKMMSQISQQALVQIALESEDAFKQYVAQHERLRMFHNPPFGMYSDASETRDAFEARLKDQANRMLGDQQERLESTFRRRIDQVKELSERDQREIESKDEAPAERRDDVNVAWGQTLYNITSGKSSAVSDPPQSVREGDYLEKIAQIQRAWDRELETLRDDLNSQAREIEEIVVSPHTGAIDIARYLIVWAPRL